MGKIDAKLTTVGQDQARVLFDLHSTRSRLRLSTQVETPLRSEILTRPGLAEYARTLSGEHRVNYTRRSTSALLTRFEENTKVLDRSYHTLSQAAEKKDLLSSGAAWLLDNYHIIRDQIRALKRDFPKGYYRSLPKLIEGEHKNYPRVYHIALEIVMHTDASIDSDLVAGFIEAYQENAVLESGELWAIPIMLRFALIENLRRLTVTTVEAKEQLTLAEQFVEEIVGAETNSSTDILLLLAGKLNQSPDFLALGAVNLMRRLREKGSKSALTLQWLETRLKEQGSDPDEMARSEHYAQAANQASIGHTVMSLKRVSEVNWQDWFEQVSLVHKTLLGDPSAIYGKCDFTTRDRYRHRVEILARGLKISELNVARATIELARSAHVSSELQREARAKLRLVGQPNTSEEELPTTSHVGYYLVDEGTIQLETHLQWKSPLQERVNGFLKRHAFLFYTTSIICLSIALLLFVFLQVIAAQGSLVQALIASLAFAIPVTELATNIVQWLEMHGSIPKPLPKLDLEDGIPDEYRTIVTVQAIFHDREAIARAVEGLEVRYLANDDPNLYFGLLSDLCDSKSEKLPEDEELIGLAKTLVLELNERHFSPGQGRFFLCFRSRMWSEREQVFMGWERKRGKISEFNRLLLGKSDTTLQVYVGRVEALRGVKFVITLDADTSLPRGVAKKLIGTLAHPLNRAVIDPATNTVVKGYGIIQPRASIDFVSANATRFTKVFSDNVGIDPYTQLVSDVYQDLFFEGSYVGKGIYDVRAFEHTLTNRVPDNALLSHDLFEGCFARVALATDIEVFDDFPSRYDAYAKRLYRWVRGDWQLLPWVFKRIPNGKGEYYRSPISRLGRWKLVDNLRRSLFAPTCFLSICFAFALLPGSPSSFLLIVALVLGFPFFANVANIIINPPSRGIGARVLEKHLSGPDKTIAAGLIHAEFLTLPGLSNGPCNCRYFVSGLRQ